METVMEKQSRFSCFPLSMLAMLNKLMNAFSGPQKRRRKLFFHLWCFSLALKLLHRSWPQTAQVQFHRSLGFQESYEVSPVSYAAPQLSIDLNQPKLLLSCSISDIKEPCRTKRKKKKNSLIIKLKTAVSGCGLALRHAEFAFFI